jgi:hypothetical protein
MKALLAVALLATTASADPFAPDICANALVEPVATPLRETDLQRGACLRSSLSADATTHALIDTDNFHGVIGGDLALAARYLARHDVEVGAQLRLVDYTFVQTAVNKVTDTRFGPLAIGAALGLPFADRARLAIVMLAELPYTRDEMDTIRASGQLGLAFTGELSPRWLVHARFGGVFSLASSDGGDTVRYALRAGTDLAWRFRARWSLHYGLETEGGWRTGLSTVLVRAGLQWRPRGGAYRAILGIGAPILGDEPTNAIVSIGVARDL